MCLKKLRERNGNLSDREAKLASVNGREEEWLSLELAKESGLTRHLLLVSTRLWPPANLKLASAALGHALPSL